jgi:two-component system, OmpR family, response regulator
MANILLVEDERNFALVMKDYLIMNGHEVTLAGDGEEGAALFSPGMFDLCMLDIMMPKKDGFTLAAEIRTKDQKVPLLFLTARSRREDIIKGFKTGADDYLTKPFDAEVLMLKIAAMLGRRSRENSETYEIGAFRFNAKLRTLKHESCEIRLSPKEAALLQQLCEHMNDLLPREKALREIWKEDNYFTGRSMDVFVVKLRKHLALDPNVEIASVHGNGFMLKAPVA